MHEKLGLKITTYIRWPEIFEVTRLVSTAWQGECAATRSCVVFFTSLLTPSQLSVHARYHRTSRKTAPYLQIRWHRACATDSTVLAHRMYTAEEAFNTLLYTSSFPTVSAGSSNADFAAQPLLSSIHILSACSASAAAPLSDAHHDVNIKLLFPPRATCSSTNTSSTFRQTGAAQSQPRSRTSRSK